MSYKEMRLYSMDHYSLLNLKIMTKTKSIFNLIIVDASGSMSDKIPEVTGGLNQIFSQLKEDALKEPDVLNLTTVTDFSSHGDFRILTDSKTPDQLILLKEGDYRTRAMTALYDAIGKSFLLVPEGQDGVFVTIFTDGLENDSKEFRLADIRKLIETKEKENWDINFMGCSAESLSEAESIGIKADKMMFYADSKEGTSAAFNMMSNARRGYKDSIRSSGKMNSNSDKKDVVK